MDTCFPNQCFGDSCSFVGLWSDKDYDDVCADDDSDDDDYDEHDYFVYI